MSTVETKATLEADTTRLQARVDELESELGKAEKSKRTHKIETVKLCEETLRDVSDEASRLLRATAYAFVEELRSAADVIKSVADEALKRTDARSNKTDKTGRIRLAGIHNDVIGIVNKGIEKSLATPQRVVDKFHETYHERSIN